MNTTDFFHRIQFHLMYMIPFGIALFVIALFFGCQSNHEPAKEKIPTITIDNLQTAYGKSMKRVKMYSLFVDQAIKEKNAAVADLYKAAARSEKIHAQNHAKLLKDRGIEPLPPEDEQIIVGTVLQTLKMALSSEEIEISAMYPNLIRTAEAEEFAAAAEQFRKILDSDSRHNELIKEALDKNAKLPKTPFFVCPNCGYIFNSDKTEECPVCNTTKNTFEKISA